MEILGGIVIGAAAALVAWLYMRGRASSAAGPAGAAEEQAARLERLEQLVRESTSEAVRGAVEQLDQINRGQREAEGETVAERLKVGEARIRELTDPIAKSLESLTREVEQAKRERAKADGVTEKMRAEIGEQVRALGRETQSLATALSRPQTSGRWGETQLRRCFELAGMAEHVDFSLQAGLTTDSGTLVPDAVVKLHDGGRLPVDSKLSLDDYLRSTRADEAGERDTALRAHAAAIRAHVTKLASKRYQDAYRDELGQAPAFVICFVSSEGALHAAFQADDTLFDHALANDVLVVSPTTLIGLLRTAALGWRQEALAKNAQEIADAASELHLRSATFFEHFNKLGKRLGDAVGAHNDAIGSAERRLVPQLRKIEELRAESRKELVSPEPLTERPRSLDTADLAVEGEIEDAAEAELLRLEPSAPEAGDGSEGDTGADPITIRESA